MVYFFVQIFQSGNSKKTGVSGRVEIAAVGLKNYCKKNILREKKNV